MSGGGSMMSPPWGSTWPRRRQTSSLKSPRRFSLRQAISATKALGGRGRRYDGKRRCPTGAFGKKKHAASFVPAHGQNKLRVIACGPLRPALAVPRASAAGMGYCNDARRNNSTAAKPSAVRTTCSVVSASRDWNIWVDVPPEHCSRSRRSLAAPNEPKPWRRKKRCCARS